VISPIPDIRNMRWDPSRMVRMMERSSSYACPLSLLRCDARGQVVPPGRSGAPCTSFYLFKNKSAGTASVIHTINLR
jgi:hypothetical protein